MKSIQEYYDLLTKYTDPESVSAIWSEVNGIVKELEEVKKLCRNLLEAYLRSTGELKIKTKTASIGLTKPKPKLKLNEAKWQEATFKDQQLYDLVKLYELKKAQLEAAQKPYMEEFIPGDKMYIR